MPNPCVFRRPAATRRAPAVRLARAYTGRERVLCCGYHGWHDWYIAVTDRAAGIPTATAELSSTFRYNDIDSVLSELDTDTACVILEPFTFEREQDGFLAELRRLCDRNGALLVFDEMWTGFRSALGGARVPRGALGPVALLQGHGQRHADLGRDRPTGRDVAPRQRSLLFHDLWRRDPVARGLDRLHPLHPRPRGHPAHRRARPVALGRPATLHRHTWTRLRLGDGLSVPDGASVSIPVPAIRSS